VLTFVMRFVSVEVLVVVVKLNAAGGDSFEGLAVVFDVVGAKTRVSIADVDIASAVVTSPRRLCAFCFEFGDAGLRRRKMTC